MVESTYPIKREIYEHDRTKVNQVLFKGADNKLFWFNKEYCSTIKDNGQEN